MLNPRFINAYSVIVCKATRPPQIYYDSIPFPAAENLGWSLYKHTQKLNEYGFTPSGVSVMIVDSCYNEQIKQLEVGNLTLFDIKVEALYGSI